MKEENRDISTAEQAKIPMLPEFLNYSLMMY